MKLRFKTPRIESEWYGDKIDPRLRVVILYAHGWLLQTYGILATLTELLRTAEENRAIYGDDQISVHQVGRGGDLRCEGPGFPTNLGASLSQAVNAAFFYRGQLTVAVHEPTAKKGAHVHLQVTRAGAWF